MRNFLSFLREIDRNTLLANAEKKVYSSEQLILEQGRKNTSIYVIRKGDVSVITQVGEQELEVAQLHQDDIFGEMSYVDNEPTSASIVALNDVEISKISGPLLKNIIRKDPLFYGRFYKALAQTLSHRMRFEGHQAQTYMAKKH